MENKADNRKFCGYVQRHNEGGQGGANPRAPKVPTMSKVLSSTAHMLPKDPRFEHGGAI